MQGIGGIKEEIDFVNLLRGLLNAYEEVSVMKMYKVRSSVLRTREFLDGLSDVFRDVKLAYKQEILKYVRKGVKDKLLLSAIQKNGKEVMVFSSANEKLYGDIISRTFRLFMSDAEKSSADIVVIGKLGKEMFERRELGRNYVYFDLPDEHVTISDLKQIASYVLPYNKVTVYHGKFINVINQEPASTNVSGEEELKREETERNRRFLFEPPLKDTLAFFETQVFASFLKQTFSESNLARYASRIRAMEEGLDSTISRFNYLVTKQRRLKNAISNKKQLATISGIALWK